MSTRERAGTIDTRAGGAIAGAIAIAIVCAGAGWAAQAGAPASAAAGAPASAPAAAVDAVPAASATVTAPADGPGATVAGMPPVVDARNLYSETAAGKISPAVQGDLERIYVPNLRSHDVMVIDPATLKVVDRFKVGRSPQHIVPSWDLRTLWVTNNAEGRTDGSLTPIDPRTGKPGRAVRVDDPYNMYATPDGLSAIVVAEAHRRLDFREPRTMALQYSIPVPGCPVSTMPTSRSTAASRSSPASSPARW